MSVDFSKVKDWEYLEEEVLIIQLNQIIALKFLRQK